MKHLGLASWRFTFVVWSLLLVLWGLVTVSINRESLLFIRSLTGQHGRMPVLLLALVIALPMVIDAARNVPRYRRRWLQRSRHDPASCVWSPSVPLSTPRVFRHGHPESPIALTWRERSIVEQGQLAWGRVEHLGELSSVRFESSWGDTIASRPVRVNGDRPRADTPAPLLFEPGAHVGVAPTLLGLKFFASEPSDHRPSLPAPHPRLLERVEQSSTEVARSPSSTQGHGPADDVTPGPQAQRAPLLATLHPVERMSRYRLSEVGELAWDGGRLTSAQAGRTVSVRLDQPFRVMLSTCMVSPDTAELNVRIEPRANGAYRAGRSDVLSFKTELPHARIDRRLEVEWRDAPYLSPRDFDRLWAEIVGTAEDSTLVASVSSP